MLTYKWVDTSLTIVIQQCVAGFPVREEYLMGDDAVQFRRDYNRAKQKEQSRRCNPNNIPITQNLMREYFQEEDNVHKAKDYYGYNTGLY